MIRVAIDKTYLCCYTKKKIINIISLKFLYFENFFQDYFFYFFIDNYFFIKFLGMQCIPCMHGEYAPACWFNSVLQAVTAVLKISSQEIDHPNLNADMMILANIINSLLKHEW